MKWGRQNESSSLSFGTKGSDTGLGLLRLTGAGNRMKDLRGNPPSLALPAPSSLLGCVHSRIMPNGPERDQGDAVDQHS